MSAVRMLQTHHRGGYWNSACHPSFRASAAPQSSNRRPVTRDIGASAGHGEGHHSKTCRSRSGPRDEARWSPGPRRCSRRRSEPGSTWIWRQCCLGGARGQLSRCGGEAVEVGIVSLPRIPQTPSRAGTGAGELGHLPSRRAYRPGRLQDSRLHSLTWSLIPRIFLRFITTGGAVSGAANLAVEVDHGNAPDLSGLREPVVGVRRQQRSSRGR